LPPSSAVSLPPIIVPPMVSPSTSCADCPGVPGTFSLSDYVRATRAGALIAIGSILFDAGFIWSLTTGFIFTGAVGFFNLLPIVGPIVDGVVGSNSRGFFGPPAAFIVTMPALLFQSVGLAIGLPGYFLLRQPRRRPHEVAARSWRWSLEPSAPGTIAGVSLTAVHF
jgi:hypothetical protein